MPNDLLLATRNAFKGREIESMLKDAGVRVRTLKDFPQVPEVEEDGDTLEANAIKKAKVCARHSGLWCLSDDTGLEVDHLGGAPGVYSARYAGPECDFAKNNLKLLKALEGVPAERRTARFRCVVALASPKGEIVLRQGYVKGRIAEVYHGDEGFGYDPVFFVPELGKTLGDLPFEEKCKVSHRYHAVNAIKPDIARLVGAQDGAGRAA